MIPPQKAGRIAEVAGATDNTGWCPIDPVTFASKLVPDIHVIGDACIAGGMPKSASPRMRKARRAPRDRGPAVRQGARYAAADQHLLQHWSRRATAFSLSGVYQPRDGLFAEVEGAGGVSPVDAPRASASARGGMRGELVQDNYGGHVWLDRQSISASGLAAASLAPVRPGRRRRRLRPYAIVGDAIPELAHGRARRRRARARDSSSTVQHLHPLPWRPISRNRSSRAIWPRASPVPAALVRGPAAASAGRCIPPQRRDDHAVLLSRGWTCIASARRGAASRSCQPNRSRISWRIS